LGSLYGQYLPSTRCGLHVFIYNTTLLLQVPIELWLAATEAKAQKAMHGCRLLYLSSFSSELVTECLIIHDIEPAAFD